MTTHPALYISNSMKNSAAIRIKNPMTASDIHHWKTNNGERSESSEVWVLNSIHFDFSITYGSTGIMCIKLLKHSGQSVGLEIRGTGIMKVLST